MRKPVLPECIVQLCSPVILTLNILFRTFIFIQIFTAFAAPSFAQDQTATHQRVLVINSYHQGFKWTDDLVRGIKNVFAQSASKVDLFIEYMDTKRYPPADVVEQFAAMLEIKYRKRPVDLIICSDNNAFNFLKAQAARILPGVPVVFCGVNFFKPDDIAGLTNFTGVSEETDFRATLKLALRLHPDTEKVLIIDDTTTTGKRLRKKLEKILPAFTSRVTVELLDDISMSDLQRKLAMLPQRSLVLYTLFFRDADGTFFEYDESARLISEASKVPVYGTWDFSLGFGIVGGRLTSGYAQGETASRLAVRILHGEKPAEIPVVMDSPNRYMFDFAQLKRFGIDLDRLPAESEIINRPRTLMDDYAPAVYMGLGAIALLLIVITFLVSNMLRRQKAEAATRRSEKRFREISELLPQIVYEFDTNGRFTFVNYAGIARTGYTQEDFSRGVFISDIIPPEQHEQLAKNISRRYDERDEKPNEYLVKRKDGSQFPALAYSAPIVDGDKFLGIRGILVDITEQKSLQDQLNQAQKMESVGRLAGGVAHDFNNMLGVILGRTELALNKLDDDQPLYGTLQEIRRAAERSADLTRQLLTFARQQTVAPKVLDLNQTVAGMLKMLRRMIGEDIDLAWLPEAGLLPVKMDPTQIDQLLANLCVNARDAITGVGKITIETQTKSFDEAYCAQNPEFVPGDFVQLAVSDNGCGMDRKSLGKIFEPFYTSKALGKGTGLGLATVYGIVKQNEGFITVYSEIGHGTTFKIYLPRHAELPELTAEENSPPLVHQGHETILLVEDEAANLEMAKQMLESFGYQVLDAATPGEALRIAKEHADEIHLLMTDVIMPEMNGRDLAKKLNLIYPDIRHLFMSGYTSNVIAHHGVLDDGVHYLQKPFSLQSLATKVCEALEGK